MDAIQVFNLCKRYKDFELCNVSLTVPKGTIMGFIGGNGAGKSTTIKSILNIVKKDNGTVTILGKSDKDLTSVKEDIGVVLDESTYPETLNPANINTVMKNIYSGWDKEKYFSLLNQFQLPLKKSLKDFSKGMKMKLSIAVALSHNPKLLILDVNCSNPLRCVFCVSSIGKEEGVTVYTKGTEKCA